MLTAIHKITINSQSDEADLGLAGQVSWCLHKHSYDNENRTSSALPTSPGLFEHRKVDVHGPMFMSKSRLEMNQVILRAPFKPISFQINQILKSGSL